MIDIDEIWKGVKAELSSKIPSIAYLMWVEPLVPVGVKDNVFFLLAQSKNAHNTVIKNYKSLIKDALSVVNTSFSDVDFVLDSDLPLSADDTDIIHNFQFVVNSNSSKKENSVSPFVKKYTFDNLIEGDSNRLAKHASIAVAQNPGISNEFMSFNPLFLYGGVGLGKTHLMHAIGNHISDNFPSKRVVYMPTEKFSNEYISSISSDKKNSNFISFRNKYSNVDVLMLDDVQFLEKKTGLQEALFHVFNELYQSNKQIVLSSDRPPKELSTLEDRLRSRFEGGIVADIIPPNLEMRIAILKHKMLLQKIAVQDEVVFYLAENFDSNVRELEGALSKVYLYASLVNKSFPDIEIAKEALKTSAPSDIEVDSSDIIEATCSYFRISKSDIIGKKKSQSLVEARMIAIYIITDLLSVPLFNIGQIFGGRDHTTIMHSRDKISNQLKDNKEIARKIKDIKTMLVK
ncbi:MAG: chromosomal replication initiator protein DnaA [Elusimicrobiota bacterium]|jgi:chromosomal replication initiator protein|nr:chromosomal replication initiator protein DnaA [Elusimicrobiota bacterium]